MRRLPPALLLLALAASAPAEIALVSRACSVPADDVSSLPRLHVPQGYDGYAPLSGDGPAP